jgi:hypothetical protein
MRERISLLEQQQSLLNQINETQRTAIADNIATLSQHGITIAFTPESNSLVFGQTPDEIQRLINNAPEDSRRALEQMLETVIRLNEANDRNSTQWLDIANTIRDINADLLRTPVFDRNDNHAHQIFLLERNEGSADDIIALYKEMQDNLHSLANEYRAMGLDEESNQIQELQRLWWQYYDSIMSNLNRAHQRERDMIENEFRRRIITADEYYSELESLRERFYGADSQFGGFSEVQRINDSLLETNLETYHDAMVREYEEKMRVAQRL